MYSRWCLHLVRCILHLQHTEKKNQTQNKPKQKPNKNSSEKTPQIDTKLKRVLAIISVKSDLWHQGPLEWWLNIFYLKLGETADFRRQAECSNRWNKSDSEVFGCRRITRACFVGRNNGINNLLYHKRLLICGVVWVFFIYSYSS